MDIQIEDAHERAEQNGYCSIRPKRILQGTSYGLPFATSEKTSYDRCQSIREAGCKDDDQIEHIVHETGGSQFLGAVMAYHERIGKTEYNHP